MRLNKKAFSLLEVFLALAICSGLLMSIVSVVNFHLKVVVSWKQRDQLYAEARNTFELIKNKSVSYQGRLAEPFSNYSYQAEISSSPYQGCELLTMKISGPNEEFNLNEYVLDIVENNGLNEKKS
jgi:hypothetical protein